MSIKNSKENNSKTEKPTKFEYIFEDEESKSIWKYDHKKQPNGRLSIWTRWIVLTQARQLIRKRS